MPLDYTSCLKKYIEIPDDVQNTHSKVSKICVKV